MSRLPLVPEDTPDQDAAKLLAEIKQVYGSLPNLHRTLAHSPDMLRAWLDVAVPLRVKPKAGRAIRELIIMRAAQLTGATYEWAHHWRMAVDNGVTEEKLRALSGWREAQDFTPAERAVLAYIEQVVESGDIDDAVFAELRAHFDDGEIVELSLTASFYVNVARLLRALDVDLEPGYPDHLDAI